MKRIFVSAMMAKYAVFFNFALTVVIATSFTACGDDDDDGGGGTGSTKSGVLDTKSGLRVTSAGDYTAYYSGDGRIDYISEDGYYGGRYEFGYNPNTITYMYGYDGDAPLRVSYNGRGYVVSLNYSESGEEDGDRWNEEGQTSLSYDNAGHLTRISESRKLTGYEYGERYSETSSASYNFTWKSGRLTNVDYIYKSVEDGETETESENWVFDYDNDALENNVNRYQQWTPSIAYPLDGEEFLAYFGLLGIGPDVLPSSATNKYVHGKGSTGNRSYRFRYGFNSDGSLSYNYVDKDRYDFSYDYAGEGKSYTPHRAPAINQTPARKHGMLFMRSHRHTR